MRADLSRLLVPRHIRLLKILRASVNPAEASATRCRLACPASFNFTSRTDQMALTHLIYVSSACEALGAEELPKLLESAVRHNLMNEVTGMLIYANGSFMQVIEGDEAAVDRTYVRILQDPRHTGVIMLDRRPIDARSFGRWSMGFRLLDAAELAADSAYVSFTSDGFEIAPTKAKRGVVPDMLLRFSLNQRG